VNDVLMLTMCFTTSAKEVMFSLVLVSSLFVSRIMQEVLNRFPQNSMEKWHIGQGRNN